MEKKGVFKDLYGPHKSLHKGKPPFGVVKGLFLWFLIAGTYHPKGSSRIEAVYHYLAHQPTEQAGHTQESNGRNRLCYLKGWCSLGSLPAHQAIAPYLTQWLSKVLSNWLYVC